MPNQYVNKVVQSNGTTLIDISDTTALAADVISGKYFYLATGEKVEGMASGGGGSTRTTIIPEQTINVATAYNQITNYNSLFVEGEEYICTVNGVEYTKTAVAEYGSVNIHIDGWDIYFEKTASDNMFFDVENSAKYGTYTIKVEQESSGGGGSATLITKSITANGTYNASDDSADGYSSVTVNVAGGASNIVTGTFKGTTTGAAMDVNLNYSGTGYPIAVMIFPSNADANTFQSTIQRYAIRDCLLEKYEKATSPSYSGTGDADGASLTAKYKSSTSNSTGYSNGGSTSALTAVYQDTNAANGIGSIVKIRSKTKMSVFIASSSYGFMANIEYSYVVLYSS